MSSIKFEVEDNVSEYLTKLQDGLLDNMEYVLREVSYEATGKPEDDTQPIPRLIGRYNHWLYISGQTDTARTYNISNEKSEIIINYSGKRYEEYFDPEEFKPWWEFAEDFNSDPRSAILERDYAYYQETGIDPVAKSSDARQIHAIEWGLLAASGSIRKETARQIGLVFGRI